MRSLLTFAAPAAVVVALLFGPPAHSRPGHPKKAAAPVAECADDTDCILVTDGCCGCHEGGKQRALPRKAREAYEKKRQAICKKTMCPQLMSEDQSCLGHAVCKEKVCAVGN
jgi:hypothetical protein